MSYEYAAGLSCLKWIMRCSLQKLRRGWVSPAEKRLRGQPLLARRDRFGLPRGLAGRWPLAHAEAPRPLARRRVRLCTRGTRRCAQADRNGAILPVSCPTLHTPVGGVCTNGHVLPPFAVRASACALGRSGRVRMRTSRRRDRPPRVRKGARGGGAQCRTRPPSSSAYASAYARRGFSRTRTR